MNGHILIIEDEQEIADLVRLYLEKEGFQVSHSLKGEEGLEWLQARDYDLLILDINLPGMDGYEVLQTLRRDKETPVILLSARQEDSDMIMGFGIGADDYVTKPFSPKVLAARVRTRLKRQNKTEKGQDLIHFGPWTLDRDNLWLKKGDERLNLPPKEMNLLLCLAETPGKPCSQKELYKRVWGNEFGDLTTVSVHIQRLRKKLELDSSKPDYLKTAFGQGYYLDGCK